MPTLRPGRPADASVLAAIHRASRAQAMPWLPVLHTPQEDVAFLRDVVLARQRVWVAEDDQGVPQGFAAVADGWLEHLYVAPEAQGAGVGRGLLERVHAEADEPLRLYVFTRNHRARRFYERAGWELVARSDGSDNEEREPDCTYRRAASPGGPRR